jgi:hypothetical protein
MPDLCRSSHDKSILSPGADTQVKQIYMPETVGLSIAVELVACRLLSEVSKNVRLR